MDFIGRLRSSYIGRRYLANIVKFYCEHLSNYFYKIDENFRKESHLFFEKNKLKCNEVKTYLADDFSKETFDSIIYARTTGDLSKLHSNKYHHADYFIEPINLANNEVFVDCGAFNGDTINELIKKAKKQKINIKRIYAFEPAALTYNDLCNRCKKYKEIIITPINKGTWDCNTTLSFTDTTGVGARVTENNTIQYNTIQTAVIDDICKDSKVTFIKMDVEGAELHSLKGAEKTIKKDKPKLAISLYHNNADYLEIPDYIHTLVPDYKLYIRHFSQTIFETVLFAVPPKEKE